MQVETTARREQCGYIHSQATPLGLIQMSLKGKGTTVHNHVTTNIQNRRHAKKKKISHDFIIDIYDTSGSFVSKIQM